MGLLSNLARALITPRCPWCGRAMDLEREAQLGGRHAVFELVFVCVPCGERTHRLRTYELD